MCFLPAVGSRELNFRFQAVLFDWTTLFGWNSNVCKSLHDKAHQWNLKILNPLKLGANFGVAKIANLSGIANRARACLVGRQHASCFRLSDGFTVWSSSSVHRVATRNSADNFIGESCRIRDSRTTMPPERYGRVLWPRCCTGFTTSSARRMFSMQRMAAKKLFT